MDAQAETKLFNEQVKSDDNVSVSNEPKDTNAQPDQSDQPAQPTQSDQSDQSDQPDQPIQSIQVNQPAQSAQQTDPDTKEVAADKKLGIQISIGYTSAATISSDEC